MPATRVIRNLYKYYWIRYVRRAFGCCFDRHLGILKSLHFAPLLQGSDVNSSKHASNYTALHFAALSGNPEICRLLLLAGADAHALNSVNRTAPQMAAFVGNHAAVGCINNFVPLSNIESYTKIQGQQTEPLLPIVLLESFHKFIIQSNVHPVRIALSLQKIGVLAENLLPIRKVLASMSEREIQNHNELNEILAFKYHYLGWIVAEINKCREYFQSRKDAQENDSKSDYLELFAKRVLKENKMGQLEYLESTIRDCVREFPHRDIAIFRQVVMQLANKDYMPALDIIRTAINGQRGFVCQFLILCHFFTREENELTNQKQFCLVSNLE